MSRTIIQKTVFETSDGCKWDDLEKAEKHQRFLDVAKLLNFNIEGISLHHHQRWVERVIERMPELIKIFGEEGK